MRYMITVTLLLKVGIPAFANVLILTEVGHSVYSILLSNGIWLGYLFANSMYFVVSVLRSFELIRFKSEEFEKGLHIYEKYWVSSLINLLVLFSYFYSYTKVFSNHTLLQNTMIVFLISIVHISLEFVTKLFLNLEVIKK